MTSPLPKSLQTQVSLVECNFILDLPHLICVIIELVEIFGADIFIPLLTEMINPLDGFDALRKTF